MARPPIVVIGSNSFTGSHIADAFLGDPENRVVGVSRSPEYREAFLPYRRRPAPRFEFHQLDLVRESRRLSSLLDEVEPEVVVNVAALSEVALSHEVPIEYYETNILGTVRLCDHLRRRPYLRRYVHISSAEVYGTCERPVKEDAPFRPSTPYAVSKAAADLHLETLIRSFRFPAVLIRSTNVYGRHQQLFKIIPRAIIHLRSGRPIELHGGGRAMKSFVHIRDVTAGLLLALERGEPGVYHLSAPSELQVRDVVRAICDKLGRDFEASTRAIGERLGQDARYWLDCSKARHQLGWEPRIGLEEGLDEVIDWIDERWEELAAEPLVYRHR